MYTFRMALCEEMPEVQFLQLLQILSLVFKP